MLYLKMREYGKVTNGAHEDLIGYKSDNCVSTVSVERPTHELHVPAVEILYIWGLGHNSSFSHLSNAHPAKVHTGTYSLDGLHTRCSVGQARGDVNVMKSHRLQLFHTTCSVPHHPSFK